MIKKYASFWYLCAFYVLLILKCFTSLRFPIIRVKVDLNWLCIRDETVKDERSSQTFHGSDFHGWERNAGRWTAVQKKSATWTSYLSRLGLLATKLKPQSAVTITLEQRGDPDCCRSSTIYTARDYLLRVLTVCVCVRGRVGAPLTL